MQQGLQPSLLDRVLVKDRVESKPRLLFDHLVQLLGWIGSLSKIVLRANHDLPSGPHSTRPLDRLLVKE